MTLDEAIEHCYERAGENRNRAELYEAVKATEKKIQECEECAKEHEQLAEWLKDYKRLLEQEKVWSENAKMERSDEE